MKLTPGMKSLKQQVVEFVYVYFDEKTSKRIDKYPEEAIPMIREAIETGIATRSRLTVYADALRNAVELQRLILVAGKPLAG